MLSAGRLSSCAAAAGSSRVIVSLLSCTSSLDCPFSRLSLDAETLWPAGAAIPVAPVACVGHLRTQNASKHVELAASAPLCMPAVRTRAVHVPHMRGCMRYTEVWGRHLSLAERDSTAV